MKETWEVIPGYKEMYEVSNLGQVRSWKNNKWGRSDNPRLLTPGIISGYKAVNLSNNANTTMFYVHRLVATAFVFPQPADKPHVLHKDDNRKNNVYTNLYWGDDKDNILDRLRNSGPINRGEDHGMAVFNEDDVREVRRLYFDSGVYQKDIAKIFGVSKGAISSIVNGRNWGHVK